MLLAFHGGFLTSVSSSSPLSGEWGRGWKLQASHHGLVFLGTNPIGSPPSVTSLEQSGSWCPITEEWTRVSGAVSVRPSGSSGPGGPRLQTTDFWTTEPHTRRAGHPPNPGEACVAREVSTPPSTPTLSRVEGALLSGRQQRERVCAGEGGTSCLHCRLPAPKVTS